MYVPVLKWKQGEQWACKGLEDGIADHMFPLFEIPPRPIDPKTKVPTKTVEEYLDSIVKSVVASWSPARRFAIDPTLLGESIGKSASKATESLFKQLREEEYWPLAVARSDHRPLQLQTVKRVAHLGQEGAIIRCLWEDVSQGALDEKLENLLKEIEFDACDIDLLLDLRTVNTENTAEYEATVSSALTHLRDPRIWRSITIAASAFPANLTALKPGRRVVPRLDWKLFKVLHELQGRLGRALWYGDYAISHWNLSNIDVTKMQMSANLRYTSDEEWVVFRGKSVATEGYIQYVDLCELLVSDAVYCGEDYSMGDRNYMETTRTLRPGNASCWRRDATNHHITLTVNQLANLGAL